MTVSAVQREKAIIKMGQLGVKLIELRKGYENKRDSHRVTQEHYDNEQLGLYQPEWLQVANRRRAEEMKREEQDILDKIAAVESDIELLQRYLDGNFVPDDQNENDLREQAREIEEEERLLKTRKGSLNATLRQYDQIRTLLA